MDARNVGSKLSVALAAVLVLGSYAGAARAQARPHATRTMHAFASEAEFRAFLRRHAENVARAAPPAPSPGAYSGAFALQEVVTTGAAVKRVSDDAVTNVQVSGVDEGDIVKVHGDHLVVLRRGRLFTVAIGGGALRPVSAVDAFGPGVDPSGTWYDEMLVYRDVVAVIGYSYRRGGTEVGLFHVDGAGRLRHRATYQLRSSDYYSSRNYASRLVDGKLVFYAPLDLPSSTDPARIDSALPAVRRWSPGAGGGAFRRTAPATRIYRPERALEDGGRLSLHTVTVCDLGDGELACRSTVVIGPWGEVFHVSQSAVYVWLSDWTAPPGTLATGTRRRSESMVYRLPLDGSAPSALGVDGSPTDQFSFLESDDGHLNVLVRAEGGGDRMWNAECKPNGLALLRVPLSAFGDGADDAPRRAYRPLPSGGSRWDLQNRFVGRWLLYGTGDGWGPRRAAAPGSGLVAVPWAGGRIALLTLPHGVERIEVMGRGAVVVGSRDNDLVFTSIALGGAPSVAGRYTLPGASQGEMRSHGFFYRPDDAEHGVLGLPVSGGGRPGYRHLFEGSAGVLFLRSDALRLRPLGHLDAQAHEGDNADDACVASCVDWYGNARPLFLRGRIFALLGYELVEGALRGNAIHETRRVTFAPRRLAADAKR